MNSHTLSATSATKPKPTVWRDSYRPDRQQLVKYNWRQVLRTNLKGNDEGVKLKPARPFN